MHPEFPTQLLYDGPTQLSYYECRTSGCGREGIAYQIREAYPQGAPVFLGARDCPVCGRYRILIPNTTVRES